MKTLLLVMRPFHTKKTQRPSIMSVRSSAPPAVPQNRASKLNFDELKIYRLVTARAFRNYYGVNMFCNGF